MREELSRMPFGPLGPADGIVFVLAADGLGSINGIGG
jgi:hypothetical protein